MTQPPSPDPLRRYQAPPPPTPSPGYQPPAAPAGYRGPPGYQAPPPPQPAGYQSPLPPPAPPAGYEPLPPYRYEPPPSPPEPPRRPSGWNGPAFGLLAIVVAFVGLMLWPQLRARETERQVRPLVQALAQRDAGARCPRYLTAVLTSVGSVSFDETGRIADHTELTGPVCDGLRHLYSAKGRAELSCLTTTGVCTPETQRAIVALSVVVHESMHLRGQFDEALTECESLGESGTVSRVLGIPLEQARMISYLHYKALNPNTPPEYRITAGTCANAAALDAAPPGAPGTREALTAQIALAWRDVAS